MTRPVTRFPSRVTLAVFWYLDSHGVITFTVLEVFHLLLIPPEDTSGPNQYRNSRYEQLVQNNCKRHSDDRDDTRARINRLVVDVDGTVKTDELSIVMWFLRHLLEEEEVQEKIQTTTASF